MKHTLLLTLLVSAPLIGKMSYEEAQQKVAAAQARYEDVSERIAKQRAAAERAHKMTESMAGKHEYAADIKQRTEQTRAECDRHNQAVQTELKTALKHLESALQEVGPHYPISHEGEKYVVQKPQEMAEKPAPMVQRAPVARASYTTQVTRMPYETRRTSRVARTVYQ